MISPRLIATLLTLLVLTSLSTLAQKAPAQKVATPKTPTQKVAAQRVVTARPVDARSLLEEMISYETMAQWPDPVYVEKQASSYDRASVSPATPGWFANADASQYLRTDTISDHLEHVMLDTDGPGAIVRFWLTTFNRHGNLRIYLDGSREPTITIPAYDLMKSALPVGPVLLAPHSSYEPIE